MVWKLVKAIVLAAFKKKKKKEKEKKDKRKNKKKKTMKKKAKERFDRNSNMIFSTALTNK